jgi:hypothetical protein
VVTASCVSITPRNPPRCLQAVATQKWWLVCIGLVLDTARDGWPPPVVAPSARSHCSSRDGILGWCQPLGGVGARCSHGVVRVQSVAHSKWRGRPRSFVHTFASRQGAKTSFKTLRLPPRLNVVSPPVQGTIRLQKKAWFGSSVLT